jgi:hypothetical protein
VSATVGRPPELPPPWRELAAAYGGVGGLAARCGVHRNTVRRWAIGELTPGEVVRAYVRGLALSAGVGGRIFGLRVGRDVGGPTG